MGQNIFIANGLTLEERSGKGGAQENPKTQVFPKGALLKKLVRAR